MVLTLTLLAREQYGSMTLMNSHSTTLSFITSSMMVSCQVDSTPQTITNSKNLSKNKVLSNVLGAQKTGAEDDFLDIDKIKKVF